MWLKAQTPIKLLTGDKVPCAYVAGPDSPPFELDDAAAAELVESGAAVAVEAPAPAAKK